MKFRFHTFVSISRLPFPNIDKNLPVGKVYTKIYVKISIKYSIVISAAEPTVLPFLGSRRLPWNIVYFLLHFWGCVIIDIKKSGNQHKHWIFSFPDFPKNNRIWVLILTHAKNKHFWVLFETHIIHFWVTFSTHKIKGGTLCTRKTTKDAVRKNLSPNVTRSADATILSNLSTQTNWKPIRPSNPSSAMHHSKMKTTQQTSLLHDRMARNMSESVWNEVIWPSPSHLQSSFWTHRVPTGLPITFKIGGL